MGIGGSIIDSKFIEEYLGMRVESVDEVEIIRRMTLGIYDEAEYQQAEGLGGQERASRASTRTPRRSRRAASRRIRIGNSSLKMYLIIKDLMNGNPNLPEGCEEEMVGHNAIAGGFQGQRQWTDFYPNCDFPEAMLNTSFDHNGAREPYMLRHRKRRAQRSGHAVHEAADQPRADVCRRAYLLEPRSRQALHGLRDRGRGKGERRLHPPDQFRRSCCLDANGRGDATRTATRLMKPSGTMRRTRPTRTPS